MIKVLCGILIGTFMYAGGRAPDGTGLAIKMDQDGNVFARCIK